MRLMICDRCGKEIDDEHRRRTIENQGPVEFAGGQIRLDLGGGAQFLRDFCVTCSIVIYEHFTDTLSGYRP